MWVWMVREVKESWEMTGGIYFMKRIIFNKNKIKGREGKDKLTPEVHWLASLAESRALGSVRNPVSENKVKSTLVEEDPQC